jgi:sugar lactone lactonase YvrE
MIAGTPLKSFQDVIPLPNGFQPEGIAAGTGNTFYVSSIPTGAVYRGDVRTGEGDVLVQPQAGRAAIGMKYDPRSGYLFVAGGPTGYAYVYNGETGADVAAIQLTTLPSFINDVIITQDAAYFTNSFQTEFYRVPLDANGQLASATAETIPLGGDYQFVSGGFNANGIAATPNGEWLIIVNSVDGALYRLDPLTGDATRIDLGGASVVNGDGILLWGNTLYVVQNMDNKITVINLASDFRSGAITGTLTSPQFDVPTTIARFGSNLYAVNARFSTPPTPDTTYTVVRVPTK